MKFTKHIYKILLFSVLGFHLGLHILYLAPVNPASPQYSDFVDTYMNSFFSQNWHLFAPEPATSSLDMLYRCRADQQWSSPLADLVQAHKQFPITAKGKMAYVLQNIARGIYNSKIANKPDHEVPEVLLLQRYLQDRCGHHSRAEAQVRMIFTKDYSKRFEKIDGETKIYNFRIEDKSLAWN